MLRTHPHWSLRKKVQSEEKALPKQMPKKLREAKARDRRAVIADEGSEKKPSSSRDKQRVSEGTRGRVGEGGELALAGMAWTWKGAHPRGNVQKREQSGQSQL